MSSSQRTYRGESPQERKDRRRAALLEAALDAVADPEVEVSVRAICAKAALTPRYFYESFSELDDLLVTLVGQIGDEVFAAGRVAVLDVTDGSLLEQCRAAFAGAYAVLADDPRRARAMLVLASGDEKLQQRRRQMVLDFTDGMLGFFGELYDLSELDLLHTRTVALFAVGGTFELMLAFLSGSQVMTEEQLADDVAALMTACLGVAGLRQD